MQNPNFLPGKYPDLPGSKPVERAVQKKLQQGEKGPQTKEDRVETYLSRIESIISSGTKVNDERGWELLKNKIQKDFTIDISNPDTLSKIAHGLFEAEKKIALERGQGVEAEQLRRQFEQDPKILESYKGLAKEKQEIQQRTLNYWLDYLYQNDAQYPTWFRYYTLRELKKLGTLQKEKGEYTKRTTLTVAPFPELNPEALGYVYRILSEGLQQDELVGEENKEKREKLTKLLSKKDFGKLYIFAQVETAGELDKTSIDGTWVKYDQGSDHTKLEQALKNKGTNWCTAQGSAQAHLHDGDFYVFYTKGKEDTYTEPRIAIRMQNGQVQEVRGVNTGQELEPILVDEAKKQYSSLPGGEKFTKKSTDMKQMTELTKKQKNNEQFTKDDLTFLYELDQPIEGFGYQQDPRIQELRNTRDKQADMLTIFECNKEQLATSINEINSHTKAYLGPWNLEIYKKIKHYPNITHFYESFPDKKIFSRTLETDPTINSPKTAEEALKEKNIYLSDYGKDILEKTQFSQEAKHYDLVRFSVAQLGFPCGATTQEIYKKAQQLGLELCPAEVGPHLRLQYNGKDLMFIAMKQILDRSGDPRIFRLYSDADWLMLYGFSAVPGFRWERRNVFVFVASET